MAIARKVFSAAGRAAGLQYGHDFHRTAKCKYIRYRADYVGVHLAPAYGSAFFSGLVTCGSVWACPVCSAKIQERRREEVAQSIAWAYSQGLQPMMVTLTFPHQAWHSLKRMRQQQARALEILRQGAPWKRFKKRFNYSGVIRALEVTHGKNGWHLHTHELWFVDGGADSEEAKASILAQWESACVRAGLLDAIDLKSVQAFRLHSVDVKGHCSASDYLAKHDDAKNWGVDREMAKASGKNGSPKGMHPFGLLADAATSRRAARLFLVYALGMAGSSQLYWGPGLKAKVGVKQISDESLAEQEREDADLLGMLDDDDWQIVKDAKARAAVLDAAEAGGWPAVRSLIERLTQAEIKRLEALLGSG